MMADELSRPGGFAVPAGREILPDGREFRTMCAKGPAAIVGSPGRRVDGADTRTGEAI